MRIDKCGSCGYKNESETAVCSRALCPLMAPLGSLIAPQPPPLPSEGAPVWDLVKIDIDDRDAFGVRKYKRRLTIGDGRDSLVDSYQEALDLVVYLRKEIEERAAREAALIKTERLRCAQIIREFPTRFLGFEVYEWLVSSGLDMIKLIEK